MRKIGLLGGTFNPVHRGHLQLADQCMELLKLDEIWWIPASQPPFKDIQDNYDQRRKWLEKSIGNRANHRILDIERERKEISYTDVTLKALKKRVPDSEFYFLTGADSLTSLESWHNWKDIFDYCYFVVTSRPGYEINVSKEIQKVSAKKGDKLICLEIDALDISSTEIRVRVARRQGLDDLLPEAIANEVSQDMDMQIEGFKEILKKRLSAKRYNHSIGVANTAAKLAGMFDGDVNKAYMAGLLHDFARDLSDSELLELATRENLYSDATDLLQPNLLHGPVGAWLLEHEAMVDDRELLNAIAWHTTGHPDMGKLAKIIYIADYIEPNRNFPGVDELRKVTYRNLDMGVLAGLNHTMSFLLQEGGYIHPQSVETRNRMIQKYHALKGN